MDIFARIESAAHSGANGINRFKAPTAAQAAAGNYRMGRVQYKGLTLVIEQPRNTYREGVDPSGKAWRTRLAAHYGYIARTKGADGDGIDIFVGPAPESDAVFVINQLDPQSRAFDEHKVMLGFSDAADARRAYLESYDRDWKGFGSMVACTMDQPRWWLKNGNTLQPISKSALPYDGNNDMNEIVWDAAALPVNTDLAGLLYSIRRDDKDGLMLDAVTVAEIMEDAEAMTFDALVVPYNKLERKMTQLQAIMKAAGGEVEPIAFQITDPFKQRGTTNVAAVFELSDGQTVSVFMHNPDTTPNKIAPADDLVSWKWMLNKKDITILVAPERGEDLNVREVARRIMKIAAKNSARFATANTKRAQRLSNIAALKSAVEAKEAQYLALEQVIDDLRVKVDERRKKEAAGASSTEEPPFMLVENGKANVYSGDGKTKLPDDWVGVAADGGDKNKFWYIGQDGGERSFVILPAKTYADALAYIASKSEEIDPKTPEGYAKIKDNEEELLKYQDVLDNGFHQRLYGVRNELRNLGWSGDGQTLSKDGYLIDMELKQVGAGRNLVGVTWKVSADGNVILSVPDMLDRETFRIAKELDEAAKQKGPAQEAEESILSRMNSGDFKLPEQNTAEASAAYAAAAKKFLEGPLDAPVPRKADEEISLEFLENVRPQDIDKGVREAKKPEDVLKAAYDIAAEGDVRYYLNGVHIDEQNNLIVSTDGHRLMVVSDVALPKLPDKPEASGEYKITVLGRDGKWIDGKFVDWQRVMPSNITRAQMAKFTSKRVAAYMRGIAKAWRYTKSQFGAPIKVIINGKERFFSAHYLRDLAVAFQKLGYSTFFMGMSPGEREPIYAESPDKKVRQVIMPMRQDHAVFAPLLPDGEEMAHGDAGGQAEAADTAAAEPQAFRHQGFNVYPMAGGRWAVQSIDNLEREQRGERQVGGDAILQTREAAIAEAERQAAQMRDKAARAAAEAATAAAEADEKAKREDTDGFAEQFPQVQRDRIRATLSKNYNTRNGLMSLRDYVRSLVAEGRVMSEVGGERVLKNLQTESFVGAKEITKTGLDYAEYLIAKRPVEAATEPAATGEDAALAEAKAFLRSVIAGDVDMMDPELADRLTAIHDQYKDIPEVYAMFEEAASAYSNYMMAEAKKAMA